ncbi:DUF4054 domain-containing protein [Lactobacillus intestinalis]|uniref:DUF4054 domain-containing protein n=1 Tax=Lactobacillus intestinalis TaxID=151781 RepID=UPI001F5A2ABD|nr:DUF4054 domain-containing protein [Lactobacillus intestinalis]
MDDAVTPTVDSIKQISPTLTEDLSDDTINALISNAQLVALSDKFPKTVNVNGELLAVRDMATRYMTLHLISTQSESGQGITSEKVGVLETHYADTSKLDWLNRSPWGQLYLRLYNLYGGGSLGRYTVVQH